MSDALKKIYEAAGLSDRFHEGATPVELWRAQSSEDYKKEVFIMQPHPGYEKRDKTTGEIVKSRLPDVKIVDRDGKRFVLGCRCTHLDPNPDYRGVSLFDRKVSWMGPRWLNYRIPAGTEVPENLAVTRDHHSARTGATHYTLAPKDDMPLELFIQSLKVVAAKAEPQGY